MTTPPPPAPQPPFAPMPVASTAVPAPPTTTAPVYEVEPVEYAPVNLFQRAQDDSHLKVLMICQYVYAGVVGLFSLFPVIHVAMGVAMINGAFNGGPNPPPPAPSTPPAPS